MDNIKEAFQKVRKDMEDMKENVASLKESISSLKQEMLNICDVLKKLSNKTEVINSKHTEKKDHLTFVNTPLPINQSYFPLNSLDNLMNNSINTSFNTQTNTPTHPTRESFIPTHPSITPTNTPTHPTDNYLFKPQKDQNIDISTGNEGVPTDRQTDRQTNQHIQQTTPTHKIEENSIDNASKILDTLDSLKKDIRLKFKRLTDQELVVFSTIYQLEEEKGFVDYRVLSVKLKLTESSIRDYVGRLIKKGIPVDKKKLNNKNIQLSISENLKKIASLPTILKLREL